MRRQLTSIPLLSYGFRLFFLGAAIWAAFAMILWIGAMIGRFDLVSAYGAVAWHAHEFLFGYLAAALAGFLLTAVPNWTGRRPITGAPLLGLFALWFAGRVTLLAINQFGMTAIIVDLLFLFMLAFVVGWEIIAAQNWRNLRIVLLVIALALANVLFHLEVIRTGSPALAIRVSLSVIVTLIMVIGGRLTSSFTRNWLISRKAQRYPALFDRIDAIAIVIGITSLAIWVAMPDQTVAGLALLGSAAAQTVRLARWRGTTTWREPLVLILHVGYAFIPLGFLTVGLSILRPDILLQSAALHAWTAGAVGVMTLGVMTRVSLGHSGRSLTASRTTIGIYVAIVLAATMRVIAPFCGPILLLLVASAVVWTIGFLGFVAFYGRFLVKARIDGHATC